MLEEYLGSGSLRLLWTLFCMLPIGWSYYTLSKKQFFNETKGIFAERYLKKASQRQRILFHLKNAIVPIFDPVKDFGAPYFAKVPETPREVQVTEVKFNTFQVSWLPEPATWWNRDSFELHVKELDSDRGWRKLDVDKRETFPMSLLDPGTRYRVRVRAYNKQGTSNWTKEQIIITPQKRIEGPGTPPSYFGGKGPGYSWHQNESHVTITAKVPAYVTRKDVYWTLGQRYLNLTVKGKQDGGEAVVFSLVGDLPSPVFIDDSTWELAAARKFGCDTDRRELVIELAKAPDPADDMPIFMWSKIMHGHPEIQIKKYLGLKQPPENWGGIRDKIFNAAGMRP